MVSLKCKEVFCLIYSGMLFISGILLIAFSIVLLYRLLYHFNFAPSSTIGPFIVIFLLGFIHLFLTWLGIKGPSREHNFHIILFMIFTLVLLVGEVLTGIWSMILWDEVPVESIDLMTSSFNEMIKQGYDKKEWAKLQSNLKCCGLHGFKDYSAKGSYPISCSDEEISNGTIQYFYEEGCQKPLVRYVKGIMVDGAVIGFLSGIFQGVGIFAFYTFFKSLRQERTERIARRAELERQASAQSQQGQHQVQIQQNPIAASPPVTAPLPTTPPVTTSA